MSEEKQAAAAALSVAGLTKTYSYGLFRKTRRVGVVDLSFEVRTGEVFGCVGPNGSGKTTTLKSLLGIVRPDAGRIVVLGRPHDDPSWRSRTGFLPEHPYFYDYLTAAEYLDYVGRLLGLPPAIRRERSAEALERLGLRRARHVALRRYSKGMVQRLGLAQALINDPDLVLLDEPMSGLDPLGRHLVREVILGLRAAGKTVFFSTHILSDAEALCDRVAVLRGGRLVSVGRLEEILSVGVSHFEVLLAGLTPDAAGRLATPTVRRQALGERTSIQVDEQHLGALLRELDAAGARLLSVLPVRQSLEDYFLKEMASTEADDRWTMDD